jgi:L-fuculose-phosphate aldolase
VEIATLEAQRRDLVRLARRLAASGLAVGTAGNLSARVASADRILITPSGVDYETMEPEHLVEVDLEGQPIGPGLRPSIDTQNHLAIYRARADVGGIVHTHSPHATAFAVVATPIPPLVAEAAGYLGGAIRVMDYLPPARPELADRLATALAGDRAILLPNHGVVATGASPAAAFEAAQLVEHAARVAWIASSLGTPRRVPDDEVERLADFLHRQYGQR